MSCTLFLVIHIRSWNLNRNLMYTTAFALSSFLIFLALQLAHTEHQHCFLFEAFHIESHLPQATIIMNATQPISIGSAKSRSNDSINTLSSSSGSSNPKLSIDIVRCSRCQRSLSIDPTIPASSANVVQFGLNSYYCSRCANMVGFIK